MDDEQTPEIPTAARLVGALAALGAMAEEPDAVSLERYIQSRGGERVAAAYLANALFGAAAAAAMMTEGALLAADPEAGQIQMSARREALTASGAEGPGVLGWLQYMAGHAAAPLRGLATNSDKDLGPVLGAAADIAWAASLLLRVACLGVDHDPQAAEVLMEAQQVLHRGVDQVDGILDTAAELSNLLTRFNVN